MSMGSKMLRATTSRPLLYQLNTLVRSLPLGHLDNTFSSPDSCRGLLSSLLDAWVDSLALACSRSLSSTKFKATTSSPILSNARARSLWARQDEEKPESFALVVHPTKQCSHRRAAPSRSKRCLHSSLQSPIRQPKRLPFSLSRASALSRTRSEA